MARIVLVHGWRVADGGANTTDLLEPHLTALGHDVDTDEADYGFLTWEMFSWVGRRALRKPIVHRLERAFREADVIVTHSNGANFAHRALSVMEPSKPRSLVHLSPALDRDVRRPSAASEMHVFFTRTDMAVRMASYLPFHPWGRMGAWGPSYHEPYTFAYDETAHVDGHSGWFRPETMAYRYSLRINAIANSITG